MVDVLAIFAKLAGLNDVDPGTMRKHRRSSSALSIGSGGMAASILGSTGSPRGSRLRGYSTSSESAGGSGSRAISSI